MQCLLLLVSGWTSFVPMHSCLLRLGFYFNCLDPLVEMSYNAGLDFIVVKILAKHMHTH